MNAVEDYLDLFGQTARGAAIDQLHEATAIYTAEPIVGQLLDQIQWPAGPGALMDTSCGDGAFLGVALERLLDTYPSLSDEHIAARIEAWEIHPVAADQARERLSKVLVEHGRSVQSAQQLASTIVRCGDFLTEGPRHGQYSAICGNPPYLRFVNVPELLRAEYAAILPDYAQADLLHSFLDRCAKLLGKDGELAMVTADRWLYNDGAARLREEVGRRFGLAQVKRLDVKSAFYRPKHRKAGSPPRIHPVAVVLKANGNGTTPIGREKIYPGETPYISPSFSMTLKDIADVRIAPWLGTKGIFLIDSAVAAGLPREHLVPAVDTDDIKDGVLGMPTRMAILTSPGQKLDRRIEEHLTREMPRMCQRGKRNGAQWLPPEPFYRFDLTQESLLVPRIAKTMRAVRIPAGVLPVNHNLSIVRAGSVSLNDLRELLASKEATEWMQHHAAPLENGYRSLTTSLLAKLPVFN